MSRPDGIIVAIDGPAGSGKSSTAKAVARALDYRHLDSGAFYRALTLAALRAGLVPERWEDLTLPQIEGLCVAAVPRGRGYALTVAGEDVTEEIRAPQVNAHVSRMAAIPIVREWLLSALREAGATGGLVADGRDIGTVVFPDAELKVFLVCAPEERARRRLREQGVDAPEHQEVARETERLTGRDEADQSRPTAPLVRAPDAVLVDTTDLTFEEQVSSILRLVERKIGR